MKKLIFICLATVLCSSVYGDETSLKGSTPQRNTDLTMQSVGNVILMTSFNPNLLDLDPNSYESYVEAYDAITGECLWVHSSKGVIVALDIINDETVIFRTKQCLTALNIHSGEMLWSSKTTGKYSV